MKISRSLPVCAALAALVLPLSLPADTEVVNGVRWTYTVWDGEAEIGDGLSAAIPTSTYGAIVIPSTLGGFPVTSIGSRAFGECDGLNYWCQQILSSPNPKATAIYVSTTGFFDSLEFQLRRLDNGAFVDVLYETFLGRAADAGGRANWVSQLNAGADRHNVMAGFYNSAEFNAIMASYGIY